MNKFDKIIDSALFYLNKVKENKLPLIENSYTSIIPIDAHFDKYTFVALYLLKEYTIVSYGISDDAIIAYNIEVPSENIELITLVNIGYYKNIDYHNDIYINGHKKTAIYGKIPYKYNNYNKHMDIIKFIQKNNPIINMMMARNEFYGTDYEKRAIKIYLDYRQIQDIYIDNIYKKLLSFGVNKWRSEKKLWSLIQSIYHDAIYQYKIEWLGGQSLDIFIPQLQCGVEYQGIQHYKDVIVFGEQRLNANRDKIKIEKCKSNNIKLLIWDYKTHINMFTFYEFYCKQFSENIIFEEFIELIVKAPAITVKEILDLIVPKLLNNYSVKKSDIKKKNINKYICKYDLDGYFIEKYNSYAEAAEKNNIEKINIQRAVNGVKNSAAGFQWRKIEKGEEIIDIQPLKRRLVSSKRAIYQMSIEGEIINEFETIAEAVRITSVNSKSIRDTANGKQKQAGGFIWRYK